MELIGNFLTQPNKDFPLDCETLDSLAANTAMLEMLGNIAGDKVVLYGCELANNGLQRNAGYVFLRTSDCPGGEILRWEGGLISGGMCLKKEDISITSQGYSYPKAYTRRTLVAGFGVENFSWEDFTELDTVKELKRKIAELKNELDNVVGEPYGIVKMWAGSVVPEGYHLCDGAELESAKYPKLYSAIGGTFNNAKNSNGTQYTTQSRHFRLPDLQGRFIVGQNGTDTDYQDKGNAGGEKKHLLSADESGLPAHSHGAHASTDGQHSHNYYDIFAMEYNGWVDVGNNIGLKSTDSDNKGLQIERTSLESGIHSHTITVYENEARSATASHENRPPYYVLAYIMKLG